MNTGRFTQFAFVLAIVALIVGLSACDQIQQVLFPPEPEKPPEMPPEMVAPEIPIGVVVAQTGPFAAAYGLPMLDGFRLASEHINNSGMLGDAKIKLVEKDDQSVSAVGPVDQLIGSIWCVRTIVGFAVSSQLEMVTQTAQDKGVVLFSSVSSAPVLAGTWQFYLPLRDSTPAVLNPPLVDEDSREIRLPDGSHDISSMAILTPDLVMKRSGTALVRERCPSCDYRGLSKEMPAIMTAAVTRIAWN